MKQLVVVLAVALAGVGAGAGYLWKQLGAERSLNAELNDHVMALEVAQQAAALAPPPVAAAETPATTSPASAPAAPAQAPQPAAARQGGAALGEAAKALLSTDAGKEMTRTMLRSVIAQQYPDLGKELGLTPEQANELMETLTRQMVDQSSESMGLLTGNGDPAAMRELQRKTQEMQKANEAELQALLGSKYPKFQEYQGNQAARQQVSQLQNALGTGGITALTDSQRQGLITALGAEQRRINDDNRNALMANQGRPGGSQNYLDQQLQQAADSSRRLVDAASGHLNSQQLDAYRKMLDQQLEMARGVMKAFGGAQPTDR